MKTAGKKCTSTSTTYKITGQAFAARSTVENNWDCSSSRHAIPQQESVLMAPLCKHASYPTRGMVNTRNYPRTLPGHRQVLTQLQPQNWNGNSGTLTCLGSSGGLFLKQNKTKKARLLSKTKVSSNPCKILSCVWESQKEHCGKLSKCNSHSAFEIVSLPDLPESPASRQALPKARHLPSRTPAKEKPFPLAHKLPLILVCRDPWKYFCRIL